MQKLFRPSQKIGDAVWMGHTRYTLGDIYIMIFLVCVPIKTPDGNESANATIDVNMPSPSFPEIWQCTDVPALKYLLKNRSCLAYDSSNGYTFYDGKCVPSDYNGCIDTYNKFKNIDTCTQSKYILMMICTTLRPCQQKIALV